MSNAPARIDKYNETYLKISAWFYDQTGNAILDDKHKKIFERWSFADSLIRREYIDERNIPQLLIKKYPDIGRSTAYEDIRNAKKLFGSTNLEDQLYYSNVHYSYALDMFKLAKQKGQLKAAEGFLKIMHEIKGSNMDSLQDEAMRELAKSVEQSKIIYITTNPEHVGLKKYSPEQVAKLKAELYRTDNTIQDAEVVNE